MVLQPWFEEEQRKESEETETEGASESCGP